MKRFNLLLVTGDGNLASAALRGLSKVFRNHFVFEATSVEEANRLLGKIQIDLVVVDAQVTVDLSQVQVRHPATLLWALTSGVSQAIGQAHSLSRHDLANGLAQSLKALRKAGEIATRLAPQPAATPDFKDYVRLSQPGNLN